jgi:hypothetical protein
MTKGNTIKSSQPGRRLRNKKRLSDFYSAQIMTPNQFIGSLVDAYRNARVPVLQHPKLSRGESRAIASEAEDRFAHYLIGRLTRADHIFINQTITSVAGGARQRIKPDLAICRGDEIRALIDLKMDLGRQRITFADVWKARDVKMADLRGRTFSLWKKEGERRKRIEKTQSQNAKYLFVLISDQNINAAQFKRIEEAGCALRNSRLFVLIRGMYPNAYGRTRETTVRQIRRHICLDEFDKLDKVLRSALA